MILIIIKVKMYNNSLKNCRILSVDEMPFGFMPEKGTIDAVFIWRQTQEEYHAKEKVPRKVLEWAMRNKGIPEILVRSVMIR